MPHTISLRIQVCAIVCLIVGRLAPPVEGAEVRKTPYDTGTFKVESQLLEWRDEKRQRDVPVKIYLPVDQKEPAPVIIFSHGLGGSRDGYVYLGEHWASRGFVSVHVQHAGSDQAVLMDGPAERARERLEAAVKNPMTALNRPRDVSFAVNQLEKLNADGEAFAKRLDLKKLGMAGHSFGAWTTLAVMGQKADLPIVIDLGLADPRFKAAIAMSAPAPRPGVDAGKVFSAITAPILHMTGTLDDMPVGNSPASERRIPFDRIPAKDQYLVTFTEGDHMIFSGRPRQTGRRLDATGMTGDPAMDPRFQELTKVATTAFWEACLNGNPRAKTWLKDGELQKVLGTTGVFEKK
jgi:predicted dienelactone hydrolase